MPQPRKAVKQLEYCSFCGGHKNDVQFIVTNAKGDAAVCLTCSLTMVHQGVSWAHGIYKQVEAETQRQAEHDRIIVTGDKTDEAIKRTQR